MLDAVETKLENRPVKDKERARRAGRMAEKLRGGKLPYTPSVMSWLSRTLDKKATKITQTDVRRLVKKAAASGS